jgi:hypothetical protein
MSDKADWNMKNSVHSRVLLKDTWHLGKADESLVCSDRTWDSFFKPALLSSERSYNFWVFYRWINILPCYSFLNKGSTVDFCYLFSSALLVSLNFPFISVLSYFSSFTYTVCFIYLDYRLIRITSPNYSGLARIFCTSLFEWFKCSSKLRTIKNIPQFFICNSRCHHCLYAVCFKTSLQLRTVAANPSVMKHLYA